MKKRLWARDIIEKKLGNHERNRSCLPRLTKLWKEFKRNSH
jgi:hypothetical protein